MVLFREIRKRDLDRWLVPYVIQAFKRRSPRPGAPVHLLLCIADHFEPGNGGASAAQARERVERWVRGLSPLVRTSFRDSDGRPPRHTFFYPLEQYDPEHLDALAELCRQGFGEVEVHLHHEDDTPEQLRARLMAYKELLARRHGLLPREKQSGEIVYGFIHGNWALDNSRPDGRCCGVNNELDILRETGCYADFTLPSAPDPTQTRTINSIYYAVDDPLRPKSHDRGIPVGTGPVPSRRTDAHPGTAGARLETAQVGVDPSNRKRLHPGEPAGRRSIVWTPGSRLACRSAHAPIGFSSSSILMVRPSGTRKSCSASRWSASIKTWPYAAREDPNFHFHYVTAREMY